MRVSGRSKKSGVERKGEKKVGEVRNIGNLCGRDWRGGGAGKEEGGDPEKAYLAWLLAFRFWDPLLEVVVVCGEGGRGRAGSNIAFPRLPLTL